MILYVDPKWNVFFVIVCAGWYPSPCKLLISKPGHVAYFANLCFKGSINDKSPIIMMTIDHINHLHNWNVSKFFHLKKSLSNQTLTGNHYCIEQGKKTVQMNFDYLLFSQERNESKEANETLSTWKRKKNGIICVHWAMSESLAYRSNTFVNSKT